ncbi:MAG: thioredoxin domain-containing protein [Flavobacteriales bacterium]|nr:thioredoxin domain-containing protein [Flavobacteriales bacterium]|tara:strand:+ start:33469 stop:35499 length:2031 start_codon:yes stop_codon:yes gene_type:complete
MKENSTPNDLINESSPYLLQHAYNPVNWKPWGEEALKLAAEQNKPLLISIGYSACHWCHVMEKESFEDTAVARIMNENFICIKVDREERPDIDQIYMNAVQLMSGQGGWPLNCFATPDGRPFYGGTYFPKEQWIDVLKQLSDLYQNDLQKVDDYANKLTEGVQSSELIERKEVEKKFSISVLKDGLERWKTAFDPVDGGNNQAPKFPMPNNYQFLLNYYYHTQDSVVKNHLDLSLKKMAFGGIYDQIGGGFSRYSVDKEWKVPHFEKMLYDNAQLISLYSEAYRLDKNELYEQIVIESIAFAKRELMHPDGIFYSALDADSEGEEGKYYVWQKEELQSILGEDFQLIETHFNVNEKGYWENGNYILLRNLEDEELAKQAGLNLAEYHKRIETAKVKLLKNREKRIKPGLDDKSLTSWNALMIKALCDAYLSFGDPEYKKMAERTAHFILKNIQKEDAALYHSFKNGKASINGYLEDYSFTIEAFISLYQCTFNEFWLKEAKKLADYSIAHFYDMESGMFYFTNDKDPKLIARKMEVSDNVIPASNSSMAKGLQQLGLLLENEEYLKISTQMLSNMQESFNSYLPAASNWGILLLRKSFPYYEVAIAGKNAEKKRDNFHQHFLPNCLFLGDKDNKSTLPLLELKCINEQTTIYVCENKVCQLPVTTIEKAMKQISSH